MPRPRKCRRVTFSPEIRFFKPQGVPLSGLKGLALPMDGLEALRLADAEGFDHETAAARMGISRPTFSRILAEARRQVARALVNGWAIRINGGDDRIDAACESGKPPAFGREKRFGLKEKQLDFNDSSERKGGDPDAQR